MRDDMQTVRTVESVEVARTFWDALNRAKEIAEAEVAAGRRLEEIKVWSQSPDPMLLVRSTERIKKEV